MTQYAFTSDQLISLMSGTIEMFREYMHAHGYELEQAASAASLEMLEGLDAERELFNRQELTHEQLTQVYPGIACPVCYADYMQSGVENI